MPVAEQADAACQVDDLAGWLQLVQTPGIGSVNARKLLAAFGLPHQIFAAGFDALAQLVASPVARALTAAPPMSTVLLVERTRAWLERGANHVVTLGDAAYPRALLSIADPPPLLYVSGRLALLSCPALAVVGSRNATAQGMANAERFSHSLSAAGLTIVSGLALGIDAAAHRGGLAGPGSTIAVIGTGADLNYPSSNRELALRIAEQGCIVSEYALGTPAMASNFPRRNRLISGLARGVLVVEAAARSGSLITARVAGEQGRDVFAIPGSIHSALSKGCHGLIKQGAKLVESAADILEEMPFGPCAPAPSDGVLVPAPPDGAPVPALLALLGYDPVDADTFAARAGIDAASSIGQLLTLELAGLIERLPGGMFQRLNR